MTFEEDYNAFIKNVDASYKILMAQTVDEFLKGFKVDALSDQKSINMIKQLISRGKQIGAKSSMGTIYEINDGKYDYVIKEAKICPKDIREGKIQQRFKQVLCDTAMQGDLIFSIKDTQTNRIIALCPNYISELINSLMLNKLLDYTLSYAKSFGCFYDRTSDDKTIYIMMEKLDPVLDKISSPLDYINFIIHVAHALSVAQSKFKYVHYDLHIGNVMSRKVDKPVALPLENGNYIFTYFDYIPVIIDYGYNRSETDSIILTPRNIYTNGAGGLISTEHYNFNPYLDLCGIFTSSIMKAGTNKDMMKTINKLFGLFLGLPRDIDYNILEKRIVYFTNTILTHPRDWRPVPEKLTTKPLDGEYFWENILTPSEFLIKLADGFDPISDISQMAHRHIFKGSNLISGSIVYQKIPSNQKFDIKYSKYIQTINDYALDNIQLNHFNVLPPNVRDTTKPFNLTTSNLIETNRGKFNTSSLKNWIHTATIDQNNMNGYKFNFECCRVDLRNYLQDASIKKGVAVNATFFNIHTDFLPVGPFKTSKFSGEQSIPERYMSDFGVIYITPEGGLNIDVLRNYKKYDTYVTAGPILVFNGEIKIKDENLENDKITVNTNTGPVEVFKWKSFNDKKVSNSTVQINGVLNMNHNDVRTAPGAMYHGANLNPRSALIITNSNKVRIVMVEGRDMGGPGLDLSQLAQLCKQYNAKHAINLDGGRSSQLMWKDNNKIYEAASHESLLSSYPVGTIISCTK